MKYNIKCETHKVPMISAGVTKNNVHRFVCVAGGCVKEIGFGKICSLRKGYGFINNGNKKEIFFHYSDMPYGISPKVGMVLKFELGRTVKGPIAIKIEHKKVK